MHRLALRPCSCRGCTRCRTSSCTPHQLPAAAAVANAKDPLPNPLERTDNWLHFSRVLGAEQTGASSTQSDLRMFFDFWVTRQLGHINPASDTATEQKMGKPWHWWGNVRLASYPQPVNSPVGTLLTGLGTTVTDLKVNQLVQAAEFRTGPDFAIPWLTCSSHDRQEESCHLYRFSLFADIGGIGTLNPQQGVTVFTVPDQTTTAGAQFFKVYPTTNFPGLDKAKYVAFSSPDRSRFFREYAGGLRYTQLRISGKDDQGYRVLQPASISVSAGQNELVSNGALRGVALRVEAFFPFSLNGVPAYIFGRALMSMARNETSAPVFDSPSDIMANNTPVSVTDANVYVITTRSNRDVYSVGIGLDAVKVIESLFKKKPATP